MGLLSPDVYLAILETAGIRVKEKRDCQLYYGKPTSINGFLRI